MEIIMIKIALLTMALVVGASGAAFASTQNQAAGTNPAYPFETHTNEGTPSGTPSYPFGGNGSGSTCIPAHGHHYDVRAALKGELCR